MIRTHGWPAPVRCQAAGGRTGIAGSPRMAVRVANPRAPRATRLFRRSQRPRANMLWKRFPRNARASSGKFGGSLAKIPAPELGATVIKALLAQHGVAPEQVSEVIMGQVLTAA